MLHAPIMFADALAMETQEIARTSSGAKRPILIITRRERLILEDTFKRFRLALPDETRDITPVETGMDSWDIFTLLRANRVKIDVAERPSGKKHPRVLSLTEALAAPINELVDGNFYPPGSHLILNGRERRSLTADYKFFLKSVEPTQRSKVTLLGDELTPWNVVILLRRNKHPVRVPSLDTPAHLQVVSTQPIQPRPVSVPSFKAPAHMRTVAPKPIAPVSRSAVKAYSANMDIHHLVLLRGMNKDLRDLTSTAAKSFKQAKPRLEELQWSLKRYDLLSDHGVELRTLSDRNEAMRAQLASVITSSRGSQAEALTLGRDLLAHLRSPKNWKLAFRRFESECFPILDTLTRSNSEARSLIADIEVFAATVTVDIERKKQDKEAAKRAKTEREEADRQERRARAEEAKRIRNEQTASDRQGRLNAQLPGSVPAKLSNGSRAELVSRRRQAEATSNDIKFQVHHLSDRAREINDGIQLINGSARFGAGLRTVETLIVRCDTASRDLIFKAQEIRHEVTHLANSSRNLELRPETLALRIGKLEDLFDEWLRNRDIIQNQLMPYAKKAVAELAGMVLPKAQVVRDADNATHLLRGNGKISLLPQLGLDVLHLMSADDIACILQADVGTTVVGANFDEINMIRNAFSKYEHIHGEKAQLGTRALLEQYLFLRENDLTSDLVLQSANDELAEQVAAGPRM